ncbi:ribosome maturation factor RimP [Helicobacter cholecystus]|uniref:Ribosome maturation factor RimP n=1 Tax=Helicobacter cholecystus TaxID=45498 RepID=A0A3D8IXG3_9HELI|nr:ribosome maturation factor RimP [Helicobacter cholecystus]RDU69952.1 ribosome maturation factor RimP [Helicobacter cholecystus]VEJ24882.1 ribosome maturation factor rimP [Helicobacter cholecystus]
MITPDLEEKLNKYIQSCGCELYDVVMLKEFNQDILRVFITSKEGITLNQCQEVSELISPLLDVEEPIASNYILEVSSPGIERVLKKPQHFKFSIGERIEVKRMDKTILEGMLEASDEEGFVINGEKIPYSQTKRVKTLFQW